MKYSGKENQRYFEVETKCGHVGRTNCVWIKFAVVANDAKDAARKARRIGRVKHDHLDAIGYVKEIDFNSFMILKAENDADPYLHCKSKREQKQIADFESRVEPDEYNIKRKEKKHTRNCGFKMKKNEHAVYEAKKAIYEYFIA